MSAAGVEATTPIALSGQFVQHRAQPVHDAGVEDRHALPLAARRVEGRAQGRHGARGEEGIGGQPVCCAVAIQYACLVPEPGQAREHVVVAPEMADRGRRFAVPAGTVRSGRRQGVGRFARLPEPPLEGLHHCVATFLRDIVEHGAARRDNTS